MNRLAPLPTDRPIASRPLRRSWSRPGAHRGWGLRLIGAALAVVALATPSRAQPGGALKDVGFDQKVNAQVPVTLPFRDEAGRDVRLADYLGKRPVFLVMGYKSCPLLCSQVLGELTRSLKVLDPTLGTDFDIVTVSVNPKEKPEEADAQRRVYLKRYNRPGSEGGWHALTGTKGAIDQLAQAIGFRYTFNPRLNLYAHAAGFVLLTPDGRISRYFYGVEYPARELKPALADASRGRAGSPIDRIVMFCYDYDPATGRYTFAIMNVIRVFGVATALALAAFAFVMLRRDRRLAGLKPATMPELPPGPAIL